MHPFSSVQFSPSVLSDSLRPHESQHARPPCPSPTPGVYSNSCPSSQCIENPKDYTQKLLDLLKEFSKVASYKIDKNWLHFFIPIMKRQKGNVKKNF